MFVLITGGSGSGKSAFAEQKLAELEPGARYYIATMRCADEESKKRVERHRAMRAGKHFRTLECPVALSALTLPQRGSALLECMSNLIANEYFDGSGRGSAQVADTVMEGVRRLKDMCRHLVVVTNEIFSDGVAYDAETQNYLDCLGRINRAMALEADCVAEIVYGIPVFHKGGTL